MVRFSTFSDVDALFLVGLAAPAFTMSFTLCSSFLKSLIFTETVLVGRAAVGCRAESGGADESCREEGSASASNWSST